MAVYYFDTSALVKRYVTETGAGWVRTYLAVDVRFKLNPSAADAPYIQRA